MNEFEEYIKPILFSKFYIDLYYITTDSETEFSVYITVKSIEIMTDEEPIKEVGKKIADSIDNCYDKQTLLGKNRNTGYIHSLSLVIKCK